MCLPSLEVQTRKVRVGETGKFNRTADYWKHSVTAFLPLQPEVDIACLCTPNGCVLQLVGLPATLTNKLGLSGNTAIATFRQGTHPRTDPDRLEFEDKRTIAVGPELNGVGVTCVAMSMADYQHALATADAAKQNKDGKSDEVPEFVTALPAAVTAPKAGAGLRTGATALSVLLMIALSVVAH